MGTLDFLTPEAVVAATARVRRGDLTSLAVPLDETGPRAGDGDDQPIQLVVSNGNDAETGTTVRDFYEEFEGSVRGTDDLLNLSLHAGTVAIE